MRRLLLAGLCLIVLAATPGAVGAGAKPILGVTGNTSRFKAQTNQVSLVNQAFLGWGHGQTFGAPFQVLFKSLGPIPMIHLGTNGKGKKAVITVADIAAGKGDSYLGALANAISQWGNAIYVRPLAEMNNKGNLWYGNPPVYRKAFARIFVLVHGGTAAQINAKLSAIGVAPWKGGDLPSNPFPRVRVLWSPLAGGDPPEPYWPGDAYVDVGGADIYKEASGQPPWDKFNALFSFVKSHKKPFSVPEWGLFGIDDKNFVPDMCAFLKSHATETEEFYESKPGSIFDLQPKPISRAAYTTCITPFAGGLPSWAAGGSGSARQLTLTLTPDQTDGAAPLAVNFAIAAKLSVPIVHWQVSLGDGSVKSGSGPPPASLAHTYAADGTYEATLVVFASPPFTPAAAKFLATASVSVGAGADVIKFVPTPLSGKSPLKVSFLIEAKLAKAVTGWRLDFGDGLSTVGAGKPPHFAGHTFEAPGVYTVVLTISAGSLQYTQTATIHVT